MNKKITIAIDAMGGDNSPDKTIEGLNLFLKNTKESDYLINLFGDEIKIKEKLKKYKILSNAVNIIHTKSVVSDEETPLTAIKNSKNTEIAKKNLLSKKWKIKKSIKLISLIEKKKKCYRIFSLSRTSKRYFRA